MKDFMKKKKRSFPFYLLKWFRHMFDNWWVFWWWNVLHTTGKAKLMCEKGPKAALGNPESGKMKMGEKSSRFINSTRNIHSDSAHWMLGSQFPFCLFIFIRIHAVETDFVNFLSIIWGRVDGLNGIFQNFIILWKIIFGFYVSRFVCEWRLLKAFTPEN